MKLSMFRSDRSDASSTASGAGRNNMRTGVRRTVGSALTNSDSGSVGSVGPSVNPSINNSNSGRYEQGGNPEHNTSAASLLPIHQQIHQQVHFSTMSNGSARAPSIASNYTRLFSKPTPASVVPNQADPNGLTTADPSPVPCGASVSTSSNRIIRNPNAVAGPHPSAPAPAKTITYDAQKVVGQGTFGCVYLAKVAGTEDMVAIKKVFQDPSFKNRELQIMKQLATKSHPYIVQFKHYFTSKANNGSNGGANLPEGFYLNLVLEYVPETLHSVNKQYFKRKQLMPGLFVKIYTFQMMRALAHLHGMGIAHRDIKPQNLLVDPLRHTLKLCDLGSAKCLIKGEPNVAYICSRFYRAPELILGCTDYSTAIDVWSAGCVFAELMQGTPIFPGMSAMDQIIEICRVMGTPSKEQLSVINGNNAAEVKMPQFPQRPWSSILPNASLEAIDLLKNMLDYTPTTRLTCIDSCAHMYFDELRYADTALPDGSALPSEMRTFTAEELSMASAETLAILSQDTAPSTMRLF